jgi:hypothetical protein
VTRDLAYDMMLEVRGLIRSLAVRTTLDRELHVGETFTSHGRRWVVANVHPARGAGADRRLIAREIDAEDAPPVTA